MGPTFQLIHGIVIIGTLEWGHQRHDVFILHQDIKGIFITELQETEYMGHVTILARKSVWLGDTSFIILIELIFDKDYSPLSIYIRKAFQGDRHSIGIGTDVIAVFIREVENDITIFIQCHIVIPHAYLNFQLPSVTDNHVMQLPAVLPCHRTEGDKEIDDGCQEVLGRVGEELVTSPTACLSCTFIQGCKQCGCCL